MSSFHHDAECIAVRLIQSLEITSTVYYYYVHTPFYSNNIAYNIYEATQLIRICKGLKILFRLIHFMPMVVLLIIVMTCLVTNRSPSRLDGLMSRCRTNTRTSVPYEISPGPGGAIFGGLMHVVKRQRVNRMLPLLAQGQPRCQKVRTPVVHPGRGLSGRRGCEAEDS